MFRKRKALEKRVEELEARVKLLEQAQSEIMTVGKAAGGAIGEVQRVVEELRGTHAEGASDAETKH